MIDLEHLQQLSLEYLSLQSKLNDKETCQNFEFASTEDVCIALAEAFLKKDQKLIAFEQSKNLTQRVSVELKKISKKHDDLLFLQLQLIDDFFDYLFEKANLHSSVAEHIYPVKIIFMRLFIKNKHFFKKPYSLALQMLEMFLLIANYIDNKSGTRGRMLLTSMRDISSKLAVKDVLELIDLDKGMIAYNDFLMKFREESATIEETARQKALQETREAGVKETVEHEIAKYTDGEEIPSFVLEFLQNIWSKYLGITFLQKGEESKEWIQGIDDIKTLIWSVTGPFDKAFKESFLEVVPPTMKRIFNCLESTHYQSDDVNTFFFQIEEVHRDILDGKRIVADTVIVASIFDEGQSLDSGVLEENVEQDLYKAGEWVKLKIDDNRVICKILCKYQRPDKTLFVNVSGEVVAELKTTEFAELNSDQIIHFKQINVIADALEYAQKSFEEKINHAREAYKEIVAEKSRENLLQKIKDLKSKQEQERKELETRVKEEAKRRWEAEKARLEEEEKVRLLAIQEKQSAEEKKRLAVEEQRKQEAEALAQKLEQETSRLLEEKANMESQLQQLLREKAVLEEKAQRSEMEKKESLENAKKAAQDLEKEQHEKQCIEVLNKIQPGSWLEIELEPGKIISCKLGLVLQSTKKMIFIDRKGSQVFETYREDLYDLLCDRKASVIDFGVAFESTLESLVVDRRNKLSET